LNGAPLQDLGVIGGKRTLDVDRLAGVLEKKAPFIPQAQQAVMQTAMLLYLLGRGRFAIAGQIVRRSTEDAGDGSDACGNQRGVPQGASDPNRDIDGLAMEVGVAVFKEQLDLEVR